MALKIVGGILVLWAIADFGASFAGIDLWAQVFGIHLSGAFYEYSAYAALMIGLALFHFGEGDDEEEPAE